MAADPIKDIPSAGGDGAPFSGGSQPVTERPPEVPGPGRSAMQVVVLVIAAVVVVGALLWLIRT